MEMEMQMQMQILIWRLIPMGAVTISSMVHKMPIANEIGEWIFEWCKFWTRFLSIFLKNYLTNVHDVMASLAFFVFVFVSARDTRAAVNIPMPIAHTNICLFAMCTFTTEAMFTSNCWLRAQNQLIFLIFIALAGRKKLFNYDSINFVGAFDSESSWNVWM